MTLFDGIGDTSVTLLLKYRYFFPFSLFSCITRINAELMIPVGTAIIAMPIMLMIPPKSLPIGVIG